MLQYYQIFMRDGKNRVASKVMKLRRDVIPRSPCVATRCDVRLKGALVFSKTDR